MKSLAVSVNDAPGRAVPPPDALHLPTEGVPDPTDEGLELLTPLDELDPEDVADVEGADEQTAGAEEVEGPEEAGSGFDPVRLYLRQMAQNGLLTREGEVAIAKRIEEGLLAMVRAAFSTPLALRYVLDLGVRVRAGEFRVRDLVRDEVEEEGEVVEDDAQQRRRFLTQLARVRRAMADRDAVLRQLRLKPRRKLTPRIRRSLAGMITM